MRNLGPSDPDLPDLELDLPEASEPEELFEVRISAVPDPVATAPALAQLLTVDLPTAQRICLKAPGVLVSNVGRAEAERIVKGVRALGIRSEMLGPPAPAFDAGPPPEAVSAGRPAGTVSPGRPTAPVSPRHPSAPASAGWPPPSPSGAPLPRSGSGPGDAFWAQIPVAFIAPFVGRGWLILLANGALGVAIVLLAMIPGLFKLLGLVGLYLVAVGLLVETFARLAQAALMRDDDAWLPEPQSNLPSMSELAFRGILMLIVGGLLSSIPAFILSKSGNVRDAVALQVVIMIYWPMAMTVISLSGKSFGALDVPLVLRGIFTAPIEYIVVCVLGIGAVVLTVFGLVKATGLGPSLGLDMSDGGALLGDSGMLTAFGFLSLGGIAYYHGVMGYLMGALVRSKAKHFEFIIG